MELEPTSHKLGLRWVRENIVIWVHHHLVLLLILDFDIIINVPENNLDEAVTVINLLGRDAGENLVQQGPPLSGVVLLRGIS